MGAPGQVKAKGLSCNSTDPWEKKFVESHRQRDERIRAEAERLTAMSVESARARILLAQHAIATGGPRDRQHQLTVAAAVELVQSGVLSR